MMTSTMSAMRIFLISFMVYLYYSWVRWGNLATLTGDKEIAHGLLAVEMTVGYFLLSPPRGWYVSLVGRLVAASYDVPVYDRPDVLDMIGTAILVAEVVSVLPDVDTK